METTIKRKVKGAIMLHLREYSTILNITHCVPISHDNQGMYSLNKVHTFEISLKHSNDINIRKLFSEELKRVQNIKFLENDTPIIEQNMAIARMLLWEYDEDRNVFNLTINHNRFMLDIHGEIKPSKLKFNNDWNWLMFAVIVIENKGYDVFINGLYCRITDSGMSDFEIESGEVKTKIEAVYQVVSDFILKMEKYDYRYK